MSYFLNLLMSGLVIGSLYGLIAMGFAIVYRATGMVNFAVGEVMMLIAYISFNLSQIPQLGFVGLLCTTIPIAMVLGLFIERIWGQRLKKATQLGGHHLPGIGDLEDEHDGRCSVNDESSRKGAAAVP